MVQTVLLSTLALLATGALAVPATVPAPVAKRGPVHLPLFRRQAPLCPFRKRAGTTTGIQVDEYGLATYTTLQIGTPPQNVTVQLDTGSNKLVVVGGACSEEQCNQERGTYHPDDSSTYEDYGQTFTQGYLDKTSFKGSWVTDRVSFGGFSVNYTFGMIETASNQRAMKNHGVLGLGWDTPQDVSYSLPYDMAQTPDLWDDPQFGMYLSRVPHWEEGKMWDLSQLTLNGVDKSKFDGELSYAPLVGQNIWLVGLDGVHVGNTEVVSKVSKARAHLDTGTNAIWGPKEAIDAIFAEVPGAFFTEGAGWRAPCDSPEFKLTFTIAGVKMQIPLTDFSGDIGNGTCSVFLKAHVPNEKGQVFGAWLIGAVAMHSHYLAFRYDPPGIGIAPLKAEFNVPAKNGMGVPAEANATTVAPLPPAETPRVSEEATTTVSKVHHPPVTDVAQPNSGANSGGADGKTNGKSGALPAMRSSASVVVGALLALVYLI